MMNPISILINKIFKKPPTIPADTVKDIRGLSDKDRKLLQQIGFTHNILEETVREATLINFERTKLYKEVDRASLHWAMGAAMELFADYVTTYSTLHNATVWITSENSIYETELNSLLETIQIEEKIFDWAWTTGTYGDHFVKINAIPGVGVVSVDDDMHPINISRVDNKVLVGFFKTPQGYAPDTRELIAPWEYVHFRILGAKRKRPLYDDPSFSEYRTVHLLSPEARRLTSKYGTSLLTNALPVYKQLRMTEDCLLFARLSRGIQRNIFKIKVSGTNIEAAKEIVDSYKRLLKRTVSMDTSSANPLFDTKYNPMTTLEDIFIPVWDDVNDLDIKELGGKVDIKWIVDIEDLRNRLACALRVPLPLLGGFTDEATGALGSEAIEKLDIRFARSARRLQRAIIEGIKRICQIHLAYKNMDPDATLFKVNMPETSTAEEESLKASLETGVEIVDRMMQMLDTAGIEVDKVGLLNFLNQKILKLDDVDFSKFIKGQIPVGLEGEEAIETVEHVLTEARDHFVYGKKGKPRIGNSDLVAHLPEKPVKKEDGSIDEEWTNKEWKDKYGSCKIRIETVVVDEKVKKVKKDE